MRWALVAIFAGCYSPHPPSGAPCATGDDCPTPLQCVSGACVEQGSGLVPPDADPSCACVGSELTCASSASRCELGCASDGTRCLEIDPSNGIDPALAGAVSAPITIDGAATFDSDTGAISGALARAAGTGVAVGIGFVVEGNLGVFVIHDLTVTAAGSIRFTGSNAVVMLVGVNASIAGTLDVSADAGSAGPGGGAGGTFSTAAGGCGGAHGASDAASTDDTGGGGGAGGGEGATGGAVQTFAGGMGGVACITTAIEPLVGGGGGGGGGPGLAKAAVGNGGGGALQLTVLGHASIDGVITAGGGGGQGGAGNAAGNGAAGSGGGGGGAILIEAIAIDLGAGAVVAANGGGGGGAANTNVEGAAGQPGQASAMPAAGGASGGAPATDGGAGGATDPPGVPADLTSANGNAGGGGGGVGRIHLRTINALGVSGTISPGATISTATTR